MFWACGGLYHTTVKVIYHFYGRGDVMPEYQVGIYNKHIRARVRQGDPVPEGQETWEETNYFDITANSESHARELMKTQYKESQGFVIESVDKYPGT